MKLQKEELINIIGGASITGAMINAIARGINTMLDLGRSLGTAIIRIVRGKTC